MLCACMSFFSIHFHRLNVLMKKRDWEKYRLWRSEHRSWNEIHKTQSNRMCYYTDGNSQRPAAPNYGFLYARNKLLITKAEMDEREKVVQTENIRMEFCSRQEAANRTREQWIVVRRSYIKYTLYICFANFFVRGSFHHAFPARLYVVRRAWIFFGRHFLHPKIIAFSI